MRTIIIKQDNYYTVINCELDQCYIRDDEVFLRVYDLTLNMYREFNLEEVYLEYQDIVKENKNDIR